VSLVTCQAEQEHEGERRTKKEHQKNKAKKELKSGRYTHEGSRTAEEEEHST
jgi:hypothetical protein